MDALVNKLNSFTSFSQPNYKQTSAYFNSKISNTVTDEVSDCIGLDFGNSNICVSYYRNQIFHVFQLGSQSCIMPSWFTLKEKEFFIGMAAKNTQHQKSTKLTVFDIRRALSSCPVTNKGVPYQLTKNLAFEQNNVSIPLVRVIGIIFAAIKDKIEKALNEEIKNVVLTIPTTFDIKQQQILVDACQIANLKVLKLLFEPVATAITYYSIKKSEKKVICVIDFGGGKLDVGNFVVEDGKIQLLNHANDLQLGGRDFDERLVNYAISVLKTKYPSVHVNDRIITMIREKCTLTKECLTTCTQKSIELEIGEDDITINITRSEFEKLCDDLFKRVLSVIIRATTQIDKSRLADVVLVGGSTRMPKFQTDIQQIFPTISLNVTINADEAIAKGACMYGALKSGLIKKIKIEDKIPWKGTSVSDPKTKTFVDDNGIVQNKITENSSHHFTDIKNEQNEIKKMFEKHEEIAKSGLKSDSKEDAKIVKVDDSALASIEKYLNPEFAKNYEYYGYEIQALKAIKHYFHTYTDQNSKATVMSYFVPRIEICVKAIQLYHDWVPGRYSRCLVLEQEVKKLCSNSSSMDNFVLETHLQYLNLIRFMLDKRYGMNPYYNTVLTEPGKSMIERIKYELGFLNRLLEDFHQTNQRVHYDVQKLSDLINSFLYYNEHSK